MAHFRYINHIRKPDGTLRPWKEYDILAKSEHDLNRGRYKVRCGREAEEIKDKENAINR